MNKGEVGGNFESPLHVAARQDRGIALGKLIRAGANLHSPRCDGRKPRRRWRSLMGCKTALLQLLTVGGPDIHDTHSTQYESKGKAYKLRWVAHHDRYKAT